MRNHTPSRLRQLVQEAAARFDSMDEEAHERFAGICAALAACCAGEGKAVVLVDSGPTVTMMAVNCDEFEMASIVAGGHEAMEMYHIDDAPPKGEMN